MIDESAIRSALAGVKYPGFSRDIVSFGLVKSIVVNGGGGVVIQMELTTSEPRVAEQIREASVAAVDALGAGCSVEVLIDIRAPQTPPAAQGLQGISGVKTIIAIASGKGGVGKSTVAANLAVALRDRGLGVGLCDCDLYGPSIALMFGCSERPFADEEDRIVPLEREGIKIMSMGCLVDDDSPAVLRGPMVTRYTQQFLRQVAWAPLDCLVLDLPPGTGDIQLTIVQTVAMAGAIVVTTPQEVALIDARKAAAMFEKTSVRLLGLVENMSYFECPDNGLRYPIFGSGGGEREAARLRTELLAQIPIEMAVREAGDAGRPAVLSVPDSQTARAFADLAERVAAKIL
jgi:ATP-binding protein involved in chromosome partitioning